MRSDPVSRRPARCSSPSRSVNARTSAASVRSARSSGMESGAPLKARASAPFSLPFAIAISRSARLTPIHAPRPGARASTSGSTSQLPSCLAGEIARRISTSRAPLAPVKTQRLSGPASTMSELTRSLRGFRIGGLLGCGIAAGSIGSGSVLVLEPVGARGHDDRVALVFAQAVFGQDAALVLGAVRIAARRAVIAAALLLALLGDQFIGGEIGQIVKRLDAG